MDKVFLFMGVCIPVRLLIVYLVKCVLPYKILKYVSILFFIMTTGFILSQLFRKSSSLSSAEGGQIWWHNIRPIHIVLYFTAAILAIYKPEDTWIPLFLDVVFAICMYTVYRNNGFNIKPAP